MEQSIINSKYKVAGYCRLSHDDDNDGTSVSIETQMSVLSDYCTANGFEIAQFYCDDGYTGTNFERPAFKRMTEDIEKGKINLVLVKDLSRFGREHVMVGYYTQKYYPENNIRFIAIADGTDITPSTTYKYDITMPIKNVFNEFFPADTSMKVRQAFATKAKHGEFVGSKAPYGYIKSPEDKHVLIVDEETAPIVQRIFEMAAYEGMGFQKIAFKLYDEGIMKPSALESTRKGRVPKGNPYQWNLGSVKAIIDNQIYLGTLISGKRSKLSFKSKKVIKKDESEWIVNENKCEPIISQKLWDDAHLRIGDRKLDRAGEQENVFAGILKCEECGYTMRISTAKERRPFFICGKYQKPKRGEERCTSHFVLYDTVYDAVLNDLNRVLESLNTDPDSFRDMVVAKINADVTDCKENAANEIERLEIEIDNQKRKFKQLYEDKFSGLISDEMFKEMSAECEDARKRAVERLDRLKAVSSARTEQRRGVADFCEMISQYHTLEKLDKETLNKLIEKITISQAPGTGKHKKITIKIYYKFVGDCI